MHTYKPKRRISRDTVHEPLIPNARAIAVMKAAQCGALVTAGKPDQLLANLNADE